MKCRIAGLAGLLLSPLAQADFSIPGFELVHTVPLDTELATTDLRQPGPVWIELFDGAKSTIDIGQFYAADHPGSVLERVIERLEAAGKRGVKIRFLLEEKGIRLSEASTLERLRAIPNLTLRVLPYAQLSGGIIHAKYMVVDGRQAFVGISAPWGTITLGRQYSMLFWSQLDADILGPSMFGSGSLDSYLPNARVDNAIAYRGTFSGVTLGATYSPGRDSVNAGPSPSGTNCAGESATDTKACRQWSLLAKYDTAQWGAAVAVDEITGGAGAFAGLTSSSLKDRRSTVAGWAKFGDVKVGAGLIERRNEGSAATPRSSLWYLSAAYPVTPQFVVDGEVFKLDYKNSANQATLFALRGTYNLSKRTAVYATAGHIANDGALALSVSNAAAGGGPVAGGSQTGIGVGIRHSF